MPKSVRLFVQSDLQQASDVSLSPDQSHYLGRVMRLTVGDQVRLFNGRDGEWLAELKDIGKRSATALIQEQTRPQSEDRANETGPWLAFAPIKKTGTDFIVEKATELGVARMLPVLTANTQTDRVNLDRFQANATEAAEQCERLSVPQIDLAMDLAGLIEKWSPDRQLLFLDENGGEQPIADAIAAVGGPVGFLVGPEGGFRAEEADRLRRQSFVTSVGLGRRIVRAETACLSALSAWQALAGDWR